MQKIPEQLIDELHSEFLTLPTLPRVHSLYETIETLAPDILALRQRNYAWDAIAELLRSKRIQITASTLRSYLTRASSRTDGPTATSQPPPPSPRPAPLPHATPAAAQATTSSASTLTPHAQSGGREGATRGAGPADTSASSPPQQVGNAASHEAARGDVSSRPAGYFSPREDSESL